MGVSPRLAYAIISLGANVSRRVFRTRVERAFGRLVSREEEGALSERATSIGLSEPSTASISTIAGSNRPGAAGHRFGPDLSCIECGKTWDMHQIEPTVCTPAPEHAAGYTTRLDDSR